MTPPSINPPVGDEREAFIAWISNAYPHAYDVSRASMCWDTDHVAALAWRARAVRAALPESTATPAEPALFQAARAVLDTELGDLACTGSDAPAEDALGRLRDSLAEPQVSPSLKCIQQRRCMFACGKDLDKLLTQVLNSRVGVEQELLDMAAGKKPMPDAEKLRELAFKLADPEKREAEPAQQGAKPVLYRYWQAGLKRWGYTEAPTMGQPLFTEPGVVYEPLYPPPVAACNLTDADIKRIHDQEACLPDLVGMKDQWPEILRFARAVLAAAAPVAADIEVPAAFMWQHDETGRVGFVEFEQLEMGWKAANPRLAIVAPLYSRQQAKPVAADRSEALKELRDMLAGYIEHYDANPGILYIKLARKEAARLLAAMGTDAEGICTAQSGEEAGCVRAAKRGCK